MSEAGRGGAGPETKGGGLGAAGVFTGSLKPPPLGHVNVTCWEELLP